MQIVQEIKLTECIFISSNHHNTNEHHFTRNAGRASVRSRKADNHSVMQAHLSDITQQIAKAKASVKELEAQKKALRDGTGVRLRKAGVAAKGKVMPDVAQDEIEEQPHLLESVDLAHEVSSHSMQRSGPSSAPEACLVRQ